MQMPHWPVIQPTTQPRDDLSVMLTLMRELGDPHLKLPPVIHVAGTNGKGSTIAYLKAIFEAAGRKVHAYISPHLVEFNERITLAGEKIFDDHLFQLFERVRLASEKANLAPTLFEATTAAAFLAFSEIPADIVLLETGLGGRRDATNIIPNPLLTIITPISYDHMTILGPTLPLIAQEKAGIIKAGVPCIISAQLDDVLDVFLTRCELLGSESIAYGYDFAVRKESDKMVVNDIEYPLPALLGDHQLLNVAAVVFACEKMQISYQHICEGLQKVVWPGRLQKFAIGESYIWLDGAHNSGAAQVLALWMRENLVGPISMIIGITKNRDALEFVSFFKDIVSKIYCVRVASEASSYSATKLAELIAPLGVSVIICNDLQEALDAARASSMDVVVTGSLFLIADVLKL